MRRDFEPTSERVKLVIVAESPPASGKYLYDSGGSVNEPLFKALMKELGITPPATKVEGLRAIQKRGWVLVDATYRPVNNDKRRDFVIGRDYPEFCDDLKRLLSSRWNEIPLVLIKANVCRLLEPELKADGFKVLNGSRIVPFPGYGHQNNFGVKFREIVGS
jgi:hypothetical protein